MPKYRVAILGCGRIAHGHAAAYARRDGVALVAGAEIDGEKRVAFAEKYDIAAMYADYTELLQQESPDIVSICTWPPLHAEMTRAAAESGAQAVHCEKPMAVSLTEARSMVEACDANGAKLVIGHQHRWDANANLAKRLVAEGAVGDLQFIYGYCGSLDLLSNGTHVVDLVRFLANDNPVHTVIGQIDRPDRIVNFGHNAEKSAVGHLYFENGLRAFIEQGDLAPAPYAFQLIGTTGLITLNAESGVAMRVVTAEGDQPVELPSVHPKRAEVDALLAWLDGGPPHPARGENALRTHEILMAIYASSRERKAVTLPLSDGQFPLQQMIDDGWML